ncbi:hypothetical protein [Bacillus safensis]|uniref:Uncharacterized protein n=1 Tax=Bacillus safensis TaxID=561879 RepID=A0A5C0WEE3_BACIA|nr:hypothetical protein FX981_00690 [Bacillus safensis]
MIMPDAVALYMSAWIEIRLDGRKGQVQIVALNMSAWIEMVNGGKRQESLVSHST